MVDDRASDDRAAGDRAAGDRGQEALQHFQEAALELIQAARALLDVAEEAVREPGGMMAIVTETMSGLAEVVSAARRGGPAPETDRPGVEHITIS
jgi:hypothetical protein